MIAYIAGMNTRPVIATSTGGISKKSAPGIAPARMVKPNALSQSRVTLFRDLRRLAARDFLSEEVRANREDEVRVPTIADAHRDPLVVRLRVELPSADDEVEGEVATSAA